MSHPSDQQHGSSGYGTTQSQSQDMSLILALVTVSSSIDPVRGPVHEVSRCHAQEAAMKVEVDRSACQVIGTCEALAPDRFEVGASTTLAIRRVEIADDELSAVEEGVASRPSGALTIVP
jgi:ferredoxin